MRAKPTTEPQIRWDRFRELIKEALPECSQRKIYSGRDNKFWKINLNKKIDETRVQIIGQVRGKVMNDPGIDYENCFLNGIEEMKRHFVRIEPQKPFYGTILIGVSNDNITPVVLYKQNEHTGNCE